jgi:curli biogenesis system outer membrane secretion channel CsgG
MKTIGYYAAVFGIALALFSDCASQSAVPQKVTAPSQTAQGGVAPSYSENSLSLDKAIEDAASWLTPRLPDGAKIAIVAFDADTAALSDYVFAELWTRFEEAGSFVMVDRRNLERVYAELNYQMSGEVSDDSARSIGQQYGADVIVYGSMVRMGDEYRMTVYTTDVEKAVSSQRALNVRPDSRLAVLLEMNLDGEIDRAVADLARGVSGKTTVAIGRISYGDTQTVSSLSAYLKNGIAASALRRDNRFAVADDSASAGFAVETRGLTVEAPAANGTPSGIGGDIQAVILGNFTPVDDGAEVSLRLISVSRNRQVLAAANFVVSGEELRRRQLSLLPEISRAEFEAKQDAVRPYAGGNNRFTFTVTPDDLDGVYYDGEYMSMRLYAERDCWFRIVHVDVNGTAQVIYPTTSRDNNFIRAGETRSIPDNTRYRMGAPYGEEYILTAAYDRPFRSEPGSGARISNQEIARGLTVEPMEGGGSAQSPLATAKFSYTILPR